MFNGKSKIDLIIDLFLLVVVLVVYVFLAFLLVTVVIGYESVGKIFYDYGSFMAGLIALFSACIALRAQRRQFNREMLESRRINVLNSLIQLKSLSHSLSRFNLEPYNKSVVSSMKDKMVLFEQQALIVESYLNIRGSGEDLLRISIVIMQINLFSSYLTHFGFLQENPKVQEMDGWKWRIESTNKAKSEIGVTQEQLGYESFEESNSYHDFTFSRFEGDNVSLNNLWFLVADKVLRDLINSVRCIDELELNQR